MLYSSLFDSSRHIYHSLQFTHVRLYPSNTWSASSKCCFASRELAIFLLQFLSKLHWLTWSLCTDLLFFPFLNHSCLYPLFHPFFCHHGQCTHWQAFPGVRLHAPGICTILNVQTIWYMGIIFSSKPCQRHLRYNSLSDVICQEGVSHSPFKTNRQVAFFVLLCLLERPDNVLSLSTFFSNGWV